MRTLIIEIARRAPRTCPENGFRSRRLVAYYDARHVVATSSRSTYMVLEPARAPGSS